MNRRIKIIIHGKVQHVSFRSEARFQAKNFGLKGWIRNNPTGTVEVIAEGDEEKIKEFLRWCARGTLNSVVEKVEHEWHPYIGEFLQFQTVN
ncbi:MAG TPA: acylphosphatase [Candidatus Nanoarchaeia archaeon]|nr:acylphosphatase [Candidatus Nanoarchaeia archaeon]